MSLFPKKKWSIPLNQLSFNRCPKVCRGFGG